MAEPAEAAIQTRVGQLAGQWRAGGLTQQLIARNTALPCRVEQAVHPSVTPSGAAGKDNVGLGELVLDGLSGARRLEVAITVVRAKPGRQAVGARSGAERTLTLQALASLAAQRPST